jgi:hypothetical protein
VLPRFWSVILGLLLLFAAPGETVSVEAVDAQACLVDEADVLVQELGAPAPVPDPACAAFDRAEIIAPAPSVAGVFRPPRRG